MGLIQQAKADLQQITSDLDGWGTALTFTAPTTETATINGLATVHHLGFDTDGNQVNSKNAHCSFAEQLLIDALYPVRNGAGVVDLHKHKVAFVDSTGVSKTYIIQEFHPDETLGFILCILGEYN